MSITQSSSKILPGCLPISHVLVTLVDGGKQIKMNHIDHYLEQRQGTSRGGFHTGAISFHSHTRKGKEINLQEEKVHSLLEKVSQVSPRDYATLIDLFKEIAKDQELKNSVDFTFESSSSKIWQITKLPLEAAVSKVSSLFFARQPKKESLIIDKFSEMDSIDFQRVKIEEVISALEEQIEIQKSPTKALKAYCFQTLDKSAAYAAATGMVATAAFIAGLSIYTIGAFCYGGASYLANGAFA